MSHLNPTGRSAKLEKLFEKHANISSQHIKHQSVDLNEPLMTDKGKGPVVHRTLVSSPSIDQFPIEQSTLNCPICGTRTSGII